MRSPRQPANRRLLSMKSALRLLHRTAFIVVAASFTMLSTSHARAADVTPGEYLTRGGWGMLHVARQGQALTFAIDAEGPNGHSCNVVGGIVAGKAVLAEPNDDVQPCEIAFVVDGDVVDVRLGVAGTCRAFCGTRAGFDGSYARPPQGCRTDQRLASAAAFMDAYRAADYGAALRSLQPVLARCAAWINARARGRLIEDIAITQYHLGRFDDCLKTLQPLRPEAEQSDVERVAYYHGMPVEIELAGKEAVQTRTNLVLCSQGKDRS